MKLGPNIVGIAALIGDRARADILTVLLSGKALTAMELADAANVTKQTASSHLAKLMDRQLLVQEKQGRHRFPLGERGCRAVIRKLDGSRAARGRDAIKNWTE
jgi:DNA-binding transcriptional ArsR family regulator